MQRWTSGWLLLWRGSLRGDRAPPPLATDTLSPMLDWRQHLLAGACVTGFSSSITLHTSSYMDCFFK